MKGSFTGAYRDKVGKLQQAHKGTIFLDEIGEMSLRMQAMLLRFLENGEVVPVGSDTPPTRVDVRVISATNRNLQDMVTKGTFREDLLYRINVGQIEVPPLRDRREDVRALVQYVIAKHGRSVSVDAEAMEALERYRWPGNVRELQNVVEQMLALADGERMGTELLPPNVTARAGKSPHPVRERRRKVADELYDGLTEGGCNFWNDVYPMFMSRDLTRDGPARADSQGARRRPRAVIAGCCSCSVSKTATTSGSSTSWPRTSARSTSASSGPSSTSEAHRAPRDRGSSGSRRVLLPRRARERDCCDDAMLHMPFRFRAGTNVAVASDSPRPRLPGRRSACVDRRRHGRYHTEGHVEVQVLRDVDIVRASAREITVISRSRAVTGSEMRMRVTAPGGRQATLRVRTTGSQPQLVGGQLRYRLWMQVLSQESEVAQ